MKPILERRLTPDGEDNPNHGALPTFFGRDERKFVERCGWRDQAGLETAAGSGFRAAAGPLRGAGGLPATVEPAAALSQRLLRAGFCDPAGHDPAARGAHSGKELSAARSGTVSAASRRRGDA